MLENVILGAGPYGLSVAAHLRQKGIPFRIFGRPMENWLNHMPRGMMLKSEGFASNLSDPGAEFTLKQFCAHNGIEYADQGVPVTLDTFSAYGVAFQRRLVPELDAQIVTSVRQIQGGFLLSLEHGETLETCRLVVATGISQFDYIPPVLAALPAEFVSHSFHHRDPQSLHGRSVIVVGAGASALDLAGLLHQAGVQVQLVARTRSLCFHTKGLPHEQRSLWERLRRPDSGLGPGLRSRFFAEWPMVFHYLPRKFRLDAVRTHLGPSAGWFTRPLVDGKVPSLLGVTIERASIQDNKVCLQVRGEGVAEHEICADHVIAATGYRVNMERLSFLDGEIRARLAVLEGSPVLSSSFESSVPGLYFVGLMAAYSFGPVMRFAFGAPFAARRLTRALGRFMTMEKRSRAVSQIERVGNHRTRPA